MKNNIHIHKKIIQSGIKMKNYTSEDIISNGIEFGVLHIDDGLKAWQETVNNEIISMCRGLPSSKQTEAFLLLMKYAGISIGEKFDFFKKFYPCSWTILAHIAAYKNITDPENFREIIKAHAMAMFLHSIEDHLTDGEVSPNIITLLLHAEAWRIYKSNLEKIAESIGISKEFIDKYINRYYSSIGSDPAKSSLEGYCYHFRDQMANTTLIVDLCAISNNIENEKKTDIIEAFECFGIAWRLLDDINDFEEDLSSGTRNAFYYAFDKGGQSIYEKFSITERGQSPQSKNTLFKYMDDEKTLIKIIDATISYLKRGAEAAYRSGIDGFGDELLVMAAPIEEKFSGLIL
jgi:hypothetical protein